MEKSKVTGYRALSPPRSVFRREADISRMTPPAPPPVIEMSWTLFCKLGESEERRGEIVEKGLLGVSFPTIPEEGEEFVDEITGEEEKATVLRWLGEVWPIEPSLVGDSGGVPVVEEVRKGLTIIVFRLFDLGDSPLLFLPDEDGDSPNS